MRPEEIAEALAAILQQLHAAQAAAGAAHERYQVTGYAVCLEKNANNVAVGDTLWHTPATHAHELAGKALEAANARVNQLAKAAAILRAAGANPGQN